MTVCSFAPSRIGIMTSRRSWSNAVRTGVNLAGVSLGSGFCPEARADAQTHSRRNVERPRSAIIEREGLGSCVLSPARLLHKSNVQIVLLLEPRRAQGYCRIRSDPQPTSRLAMNSFRYAARSLSRAR